jgi:folylpolyglutamate synthase/dihydropteroate synthase
VTLEQDWQKALNKALSNCGKEDLLCVAGSLYLVGAVREELMEKKFSVPATQDRAYKR